MHNDPVTVHKRPITRRQFLIYSGLGATALGISACASGALQPAAPPPTAAAPATTGAELALKLTPRAAESSILPGNPTRVLAYAGELLHGDPAALTTLPGSYLGPIVRVQRGQTMQVHLHNELDEPTNVHWHGLVIPAAMDGQPDNLVAPGAETLYTFTVHNRPGTYWFHPHPHGRTAEQAYGGLAGLVIVTDADEAALGLPSGERDIPLILQDRRFDADNQLVYHSEGMEGMTDQMMGLLGDRILVNGQVDATLPVATQPYRLRLLNGANARIFKLAWSNGAPLTVIGTDGGLLAAPATFPYVMLSPGERVELWADFSQETARSEVRLVSLPYTGVEASTMAMMHEPLLPNGAPFDIMTFAISEAVAVSGAVASSGALPATLLAVEPLAAAMAGSAAPRPFVFAMDDAMNWTINGRVYEMGVVADDEVVQFGATEVWEFSNQLDAPVGSSASVGGSSMAGMDHSAHMQHGAAPGGEDAAADSTVKDFMAHPVHVHGVQFQVIDRQVEAAQRAGWETVKDGLVDQGWKDTVLVMPGERVQVALRFDGYRGVYLLHCHNLEHEDGGMMRNFEIR